MDQLFRGLQHHPGANGTAFGLKTRGPKFLATRSTIFIAQESKLKRTNPEKKKTFKLDLLQENLDLAFRRSLFLCSVIPAGGDTVSVCNAETTSIE